MANGLPDRREFKSKLLPDLFIGIGILLDGCMGGFGGAAETAILAVTAGVAQMTGGIGHGTTVFTGI